MYTGQCIISSPSGAAEPKSMSIGVVPSGLTTMSVGWIPLWARPATSWRWRMADPKARRKGFLSGIVPPALMWSKRVSPGTRPRMTAVMRPLRTRQPW